MRSWWKHNRSQLAFYGLLMMAVVGAFVGFSGHEQSSTVSDPAAVAQGSPYASLTLEELKQEMLKLQVEAQIGPGPASPAELKRSWAAFEAKVGIDQVELRQEPAPWDGPDVYRWVYLGDAASSHLSRDQLGEEFAWVLVNIPYLREEVLVRARELGDDDGMRRSGLLLLPDQLPVADPLVVESNQSRAELLAEYAWETAQSGSLDQYLDLPALQAYLETSESYYYMQEWVVERFIYQTLERRELTPEVVAHLLQRGDQFSQVTVAALLDGAHNWDESVEVVRAALESSYQSQIRSKLNEIKKHHDQQGEWVASLL